MRSSVVVVLSLLAAVPMGGCHRYVSSSLDGLSPNEGVRLTITRSGATELSRVAGVQGEVPRVRGTFVDQDGTSLLLRVSVGRRQEGLHTLSMDQTVRIPLESVLQTEVRELDVLNTSLIVAGATAGAVLLLGSIIDSHLDGDSSTDPVGPLESRVPVPIFRWHLGR